jgi:hypothetical protein
MRTVAEWDALVYGESNTFIESRFAPIQKLAPQGSARDAVLARLSTCAGVVLTDKDTVESSLQITKVFYEVPKELTQKIQKCFDEGVVAAFDGVENIEALVASEHLWANADDFALRALAQMYSGFLYYWEWENNVADEVWLDARRQWKRVARKILEMNVEGFDTLGLVENNFDELPADVIKVAESAYHGWFSSGEYKKDEPPKACVWVSDYLIDGVRTLLQKIGQPTLIWVNFTALAERMASLLGLTYVGGGEEIPEYTGQSLILSIKSHGTGKNLQAWSNNIVAAPINDPAMWEQLLARTHRMGQTADTVNVYTFQHAIFGASFNRARYMSKAVGDCTGNTRRINYADIVSEKLG